jgi:dolichol-phosphate mannosyltransferase
MPEAPKLIHSVSVIIVALNEEAVIERVVRGAAAAAQRLIERYEFILVDDASSDQTGAIMEQLALELPFVSVVHNPGNLGFGGSYMRGVGAARMDYVMLLCGDDGLPTANLPLIIEKIGTADIVIPYMRNLREIKTPLRYAISRSYTMFLNFLFGYRLRYYNGLAVHKRALVAPIQVASWGFGFQGEILVKLLRSGCSYVEVGVDGAPKVHQRSVLLTPANVVNVLRTCLALTRESHRFKAPTPPSASTNPTKRDMLL